MQKEELTGAYEVRRKVFIEEQGFSEAAEFDGLDSEAIHFIAIEGTDVIGTARIHLISEGTAKMERFAILKPLRSRGIGTTLLHYIEEKLSESGIGEIVLHAQCPVIAFYRNSGFKEEDGIFMEEGVPHIKMRKMISREKAAKGTEMV